MVPPRPLHLLATRIGHLGDITRARWKHDGRGSYNHRLRGHPTPRRLNTRALCISAELNNNIKTSITPHWRGQKSWRRPGALRLDALVSDASAARRFVPTPASKLVGARSARRLCRARGRPCASSVLAALSVAALPPRPVFLRDFCRDRARAGATRLV